MSWREGWSESAAEALGPVITVDDNPNQGAGDQKGEQSAGQQEEVLQPGCCNLCMPKGERDEEPDDRGGCSQGRGKNTPSRMGRPGEADFCHGWEARHYGVDLLSVAGPSSE